MHSVVSRLAWLVLPLALFFVARSAAAQHQDHRLTVAAYNVEFMLDVYDDPYTKDEGHPPKPLKEIELICKAVRKINPDVITFEEVENEGVMRAAVHEFLPELGYEYIAADTTNSERGQNLGIISRKPIVSMTSHRFLPLHLPGSGTGTGGEGQTWHFGRDLWKVVIQATPTKTVTFFVVHLKSRYDSEDDPRSDHWREAEALVARRIIGKELAANPNELAVMLGDFNDTPGSPAITRLLEPGPDGVVLTDVCADLPWEKRLTFRHPPYRKEGPIDYILATPAMAKRLIPGSARVLADESVLGGSDHAPITATFDLGE